MSEYKYPTETIDLPSAGKLYPEGSPLKSGRVEIKYMTAKEEDILTSANLIQKGLVFDRLMESLIVTPGVKPDDLLTGDLDAVTVASRILAFGKDYPFEVGCGRCGNTFQHNVDLTKLETIDLVDGGIAGEYSTTLPSGIEVKFKLLTRAAEKEAQKEAEALRKIDISVSDKTVMLHYMITEVAGNRDRKTIREFAESMIIRDVRALREAYKKASPGVQFDLDIECTSCSNTIKARMPFGANFFWPEVL